MGPITKLMGPLLDEEIENDAVIICFDDDVVYKKCTFLHLASAVLNEPETVFTMCNLPLEGYKAFAGRKSTLLPLATMHRPQSCYRVDDDFIQASLEVMRVKVKSLQNGISPFCSLDILRTLKGPQFNDGLGLLWDRRRSQDQQNCKNEVFSQLKVST